MRREDLGRRNALTKPDQRDPERAGRRWKGFDPLAATPHERERGAAREEGDVGPDRRADRAELDSVKAPDARERAQRRAGVARSAAQPRRHRNALPHADMRARDARARGRERSHRTMSQLEL